MGKKMVCIYLVLLTITLACNNSGDTKFKSDPTKSTTGANKADEQDTVLDGRGKDTIDVVFPINKTQVVLLGQLKGISHQVVVRVPVQAQKLIATVHSTVDSLTNIRINRVVFPDGTSNGPLGTSVSLATPEKGVYQLIIGHNLMAEGGLARAFRLEVKKE